MSYCQNISRGSKYSEREWDGHRGERERESVVRRATRVLSPSREGFPRPASASLGFPRLCALIAIQIYRPEKALSIFNAVEGSSHCMETAIKINFTRRQSKMITQVYIWRERNRLNRRESINRTRAQEILFIRTHYKCASCLWYVLTFVFHSLLSPLPLFLSSYFFTSPPCLSYFSYSAASHALRVKTAWSMQHMAPWIVFYDTGLPPRPLFACCGAGIGFYVPMQMAH